MTSWYTKLDDIPNKVQKLTQAFKKRLSSQAPNGVGDSLKERLEQLTSLQKMIAENIDGLCDVVHKDLKRHPSLTKKILMGCIGAIKLAIAELPRWSQVVDKGNGCQVRYCPRGVALVIGTWNFPCPLVFKPVASAIAAGNSVLVKLNEVCENTSIYMEKLFKKYISEDFVQVVQGDVPVATRVLEQKYDIIFYTGNTNVGKIIMSAAAKHLTPCILELGGKNPVIVCDDANIENAAKKIVDGRFKNTGQFCVAPDYVLCSSKVRENLVTEMVKAVSLFFTCDPSTCSSYGRIVSSRHCQRVVDLLKEEHGGKIVCGGSFDINENYVEPTIVVDPQSSSGLMQKEIFGPILTVFTCESIESAIEHVNTNATPLAMYVFSKNQKTCEQIIDSTQSGGACANDVIVHMLNEVIPFGGCGDSGFGNYHGVYGFKAFSHERGVKIVSSDCDGGLRFPPYKL